MSTQPEALRLADLLAWGTATAFHHAQAAAELRRLHADAKDAERYRWLRTQIERQRLVIAERCGWYGLKSWSGDDPDKHIDAAIKASEGEKP